MRIPLVAGNWKMNGSRASVAELTQGVVAGAADIDGAEILLCPPALFLSQVLTGIEGSPVELGAQDLYMEAGGASSCHRADAVSARYCLPWWCQW